jgi:ElaB/YqjD/DUF883 family membrane-anchored ribosome-binding protein
MKISGLFQKDIYRNINGVIKVGQQDMSTGSGDEVLVRLPDDKRLVDELNTLIKTTEYLRLKNSSNLTPSIQSILRSRGDENTKRREEIQEKLKDLIARATVFACGSKVEISNRDSKVACC